MKETDLHSDHEETLYQRIAEGDTTAFTTLHASFRDQLLFYGKRFLKEWQDVEDIVSDAFLQLWLSRNTIQSNAHLMNFLYLTVRHKALDRKNTIVRREQLLKNAERPEETDEAGLEAELVRVEMIRLLAKAVDTLPAKYQQIFELSYYQEHSPAEIARILQINPDTVRSQKRRAIEMIRNWIKDKAVFIIVLLCHCLLIFAAHKNIFHFLAR